MKRLVLGLFLLCPLLLSAQQIRSLTDSLHYKVEMQSTLSSGDHTPLWLNANRYGLSSLKTANGYLRGAVSRPVEADADRRWGVGYMLDVAVPAGFTSHFVVQQAYGEVRWLKGLLTVGSKEYPMELKNNELSSGSQTLGINARPIPQVRLALPDYWTVPHTRNWLALKGHIAYGRQTDSRWQEDFTDNQFGSRYVKGALYHSKAGYLRIGPRNVTLELGLEMACQFGGTTYLNDGSGVTINNKSDLSAFIHALFPGGSDAKEAGTTGVYENADGNHVGSWVARLNVDQPSWCASLYADHFFEDHSSMFFMDYDGYGTGANWNVKEKSRYFLYDLKDIMLGVELQLKRVPWLSNIVVEYLCTKYQSGPVYHDHTKNVSTHISGRDDYYNHSKQSGWQHWGMVMGNPLFLSPIYNGSGDIKVKNNRFVAWHFGISGNPAAGLHYRVLATTQKGYGTYNLLYPDPRYDVSLLAEGAYTFPKTSFFDGWSVKAAVGWDHGEIYGKQTGFQLTVTKRCKM